MTETPLAAGYIRVSTDEQAREGYSLDAQRHVIEQYCADLGWPLVRVFEDAGVSGKSTNRDGLQSMLAAAQQGAFVRLVFLKMDRLSRRLRDVLAICDELERLGVQPVSIKEGIDLSTSIGRMQRNIVGTFAEFERESIVERIKIGLKEKAEQGDLVGPLPLGYVRDDQQRIVRDPVVAPLVREMFERYATGGHSLREIARWASEVGLRSAKGNPLDRCSVRKTLTNVAYTGQVTYYARRGGGAIRNGNHEAIIDAATFGAVQQALEDRRRSVRSQRPFGKEPYPLSQIAVCASDGAGMVGTQANKKGRRYMRCSTAQRHGRDACPQRMVQADVLEAQIGAYVSGMKLPPQYLGEVISELRRRIARPDDSAEQSRIEREFTRLKKLYRWGDLDDREYKREIEPLKRRLAELDRPHAVVDVERAAALLENVGSLWNQSPRATQRAFVREVFAKIEVRGQQVEALTPKPLYEPLFKLDRQVRFGGEGGVIWLPGLDSNQQHLG